MTAPIAYSTPASREELKFPEVKLGDVGNKVKRVQEWLCLNDCPVNIDKSWGPATNRALNRFANVVGLPFNDALTLELWDKLTAPMRLALLGPVQPDVKSVPTSDLMRDIGLIHFNCKVKEIGGNNRGPWVRLYMDGREGTQWAWCAGFVSFLMRQACYFKGIETPIPHSISASGMIRDAKAKGRYIEGRDLTNLMPVTIFALKGGTTGYKHVGLAISPKDGSVNTIEGNTNGGGSADGDGIYRRTRAIMSSDYIYLN